MSSDCPIGVSAEHLLGTFANAFRVIQGDSPDECLLDFLVYSEVGGRAKVVSRIRVRSSLLPDIRDRLNGLLKEMPDSL